MSRTKRSRNWAKSLRQASQEAKRAQETTTPGGNKSNWSGGVVTHPANGRPPKPPSRT